MSSHLHQMVSSADMQRTIGWFYWRSFAQKGAWKENGVRLAGRTGWSAGTGSVGFSPRVRSKPELVVSPRPVAPNGKLAVVSIFPWVVAAVPEREVDEVMPHAKEEAMLVDARRGGGGNCCKRVVSPW